ncbi:hypothetical protein B0O99DRAFT_661628 [Bisporella sp. PMI_857]|nr:hypothetical protein B0O99DRAFT_661628 [Bisporella sp. PMI_857]
MNYLGLRERETCGTAVTKKIAADVTDHVEGLPEAAAKDSGYHAALCNLWLCRGLQYDPASSSVQTYSPGQVVPIKINIRIKHAGTANVSVVDTKTNSIIGSQLLYWSDYANEKLPSLPANNSAFSVTIPNNLEGKCTTAGDCVIQWWWYGVGAKQTYESCVDFVIKPLRSSRIMRV